MEEDVGLLAVDRHIAGGAFGNGIGRGGDVLLLFIFRPALRRIGLDGRVLAQIGVGDGEEGVSGALDVFIVDIFDDDLLSCRRVRDRLSRSCISFRLVFVWNNIRSLRCSALVNLLIALLLV